MRTLARAVGALALGLFARGCAGPDGGAPGAFIALGRDFEPFRTWPRRDLGTLVLLGHPPGAQEVYVSRPLEPGETEYPVGAMILKVTRGGTTPQDWSMFAMVKRGGDYNAAGARGWEFLVLRLAADGRPVVFSRGESPSPVSGDPYAEVEGAGCNTCHGSEDARALDGILTPELRPTVPGA